MKRWGRARQARSGSGARQHGTNSMMATTTTTRPHLCRLCVDVVALVAEGGAADAAGGGGGAGELLRLQLQLYPHLHLHLCHLLLQQGMRIANLRRMLTSRHHRPKEVEVEGVEGAAEGEGVPQLQPLPPPLLLLLLPLWQKHRPPPTETSAPTPSAPTPSAPTPMDVDADA